MRTNLSKKLLAALLSLAMVLSLVGIQPASANAAAKLSVTKKASMEAGKTVTYTVKGVKKTQYIKVTKKNANVTVKFNGKKVSTSKKIAGTGKNLSLKVTAKEVNKNYTNAMTIKVYNKKTNKVVKTLKVSTKVLTQYVEEKELAIESLEIASTNGKYLVVKFSKAFDSLSVADITIRVASTGVLKGVESVKLSTDGKTANVTLVGSEDGAGNVFLQYNTDYTFAVEKNGERATATFSMDRPVADLTVTDVDVQKGTIELDGTEYVLPEALGVNYQEALGRTVCVSYNKNNTITKFSYNDEKVIYAAVEFGQNKTNNKYRYLDLLTGTEYYVQEANSGAVKATRTFALANGHATEMTTITAGNTDVDTAGRNAQYAKIVLNSNGSVKTVAYFGWNASMLIEKVEGNVISAGTTYSANLKDYTIIKDGKQIAASELVAGDVIFFDNLTKMADVYTNVKTGALTKVYAGRFTFDGKTFEETYAKYNYPNNGQLLVDDDYMTALKAGGKDITVYFGRQGEVRYIMGDLGETETTGVDLILTKDAETYNSALKNIIVLTGWDTESKKVVKYEVNVADLEYVDNGTNAYFTKKGSDSTGYCIYDQTIYATGFNTASADLGTTTGDDDIIDGVNDQFSAPQMVSLELDKNGKVIGLSTNLFTNYSGDHDGTNTGTEDFTFGFKTIDGKQVSSSTAVYLFDDDAVESKRTATAMTYGEFTGAMTNANAMSRYTNTTNAANVVKSVSYYVSRGNVYAIVIDKDALVANTDGSVTKKYVVSNAEYTTKGLLDSLTVVNGTTFTTFTDFGTNGLADVLTTGDVVDITVAPNTTTVLGISSVYVMDESGKFDRPSANGKGFNVLSGSETSSTPAEYAMATTVAPTIVFVDDTDPQNIVVKSCTFDEIERLSDDLVVDAYLLAGSGSLVDTFVITTENVNDLRAAQTNITQTAVDTAIAKDYSLDDNGAAFAGQKMSKVAAEIMKSIVNEIKGIDSSIASALSFEYDVDDCDADGDGFDDTENDTLVDGGGQKVKLTVRVFCAGHLIVESNSTATTALVD